VGRRRRLGDARTGKKLEGVLLRECVPKTNFCGGRGGGGGKLGGGVEGELLDGEEEDVEVLGGELLERGKLDGDAVEGEVEGGVLYGELLALCLLFVSFPFFGLSLA
jgi:hypothetical protein